LKAITFLAETGYLRLIWNPNHYQWWCSEIAFVGKAVLLKVITALCGGGGAGFTEQLPDFRLFFSLKIGCERPK